MKRNAAKAGRLRPPRHLSKEAAAWWREVLAEFELEPHHMRILQLAAEAWDRAQAARVALVKVGTTYQDRFNQPHARPEVAIARDAAIGFARLCRELGFDVRDPDSRPPRVGGARY